MNTIFRKHISSLIILIIFSLAILFGILFFFSSMGVKVSKVIEIQERIASYEKNKKAFAEEAKKLQTLQNRVVELESMVVTKESVPALLSTFESLAQGIGTDIEITSVQTLIENDKPKLVVEFNTNGSYNQIHSFLNILQHQKFQIKITKLIFLSSQEEKIPDEISPTEKVKTLPSIKEKQWQGVATIEILSF